MTRIGWRIGVTAALAASVTACGAARHPAPAHRSTTPHAGAPTAAPRPLQHPILLPGAHASGPLPWTPAVELGGHVVAWVKRTGEGAVLVRFDQRYLRLNLHAGAVDPGGTGWRYGPAVADTERPGLVAAFNSGFRLNTDTGGFLAFGRVGRPLVAGDASVVTYVDGTSDVGAWHEEIPAPGRPYASVRQTLHLLIDRGQPTDVTCGPACWGAPLHGIEATARSALGVTAAGDLVWAGGEGLTVPALADALVGGGVVRAMELDINPDWVSGFLYAHPGGGAQLDPVPLIAAQLGGPDKYVTASNRDFFTLVGR